MATRTGIIALDAMLAVMSERISSAVCFLVEQLDVQAMKNTSNE